MATLFLFGAVVQLNDPDPWLWVGIYLAASLATVASVRWPAQIILPVIVGTVAIIWAVTLAPAVVARVPFLEMFSAWEMQNVGIEQSREMYGLLVIALWMFVLAWRGSKSKRSSQQENSV